MIQTCRHSKDTMIHHPIITTIDMAIIITHTIGRQIVSIEYSMIQQNFRSCFDLRYYNSPAILHNMWHIVCDTNLRSS